MNHWATALVTFLLLHSVVLGGDWPCWRGPLGDGRSGEIGVPVRWSKTDNVAWRTAIPGRGYSSPVIWGDRVFLTTCKEKELERVLLCLDRRDGRILWERVVLTAPLEKKHRLNSYASATPATDGKHVWVSFLQNPRMAVACYDFDGKLIWSQSPGEFHSVHGYCSSPVLYQDLVILNGDQDAVAFLVALEKKTGKERWRTDRPNRTRSYCTPIIVEAAGRKQLVLSGSKSIASYDPDTGKQWWLIDGPTEQFVASLVYADNLFFMTAGYPTYHIMGIRPDGLGNVTNTHVAWHRAKETRDYVPSPIAHGNYFFLVNDTGEASCWDSTGKKQWVEKLGKHHSASPVSAAGLLYFVDDDGKTFVVRAGNQFELVACNDLDDECYSSPAIAHGQLFIRTLNYLYCIGSHTKESSH